MKLHGQAGYAMAALLVAMSIMAIMMTVVMPVWKQAAQREKEAELIFRGQQYAHAIGLFQKKFANAFPPNIDVLVEQRFLRKKFKDPITNDDFLLLPGGAGAAAPGTGAPGSATPGAQAPGQRGAQPPGGSSGTTTARQPSQPQGGRGGSQTQPGGALRGVSDIGTPGAGGGTTAGVGGVASKSKEQSIRLYNGRNHYNEWAFVYVPQVQAPAAGAPGTATPGPLGPLGPGGRGGQRGSSPFDGPAGSGRRGGQPPNTPSPRGRF